MMDQDKVCCLCGDIGFSHNLFRCSSCRFRFQHSYCSNYYNGDESSWTSTLCDWCEIQDGNSLSSSSMGRSSNGCENNKRSWEKGHVIRSQYASKERIKIHHHQLRDQNQKQSTTTNKNNNSSSSPRPNGHRRYKLLKDVMC